MKKIFKFLLTNSKTFFFTNLFLKCNFPLRSPLLFLCSNHCPVIYIYAFTENGNMRHNDKKRHAKGRVSFWKKNSNRHPHRIASVAKKDSLFNEKTPDTKKEHTHLLSQSLLVKKISVSFHISQKWQIKMNQWQWRKKRKKNVCWQIKRETTGIVCKHFPIKFTSLALVSICKCEHLLPFLKKYVR